MKKRLCFCLLTVCFYFVPLFAKTSPSPGVLLPHRLTIPISYTFNKKATVLYLPSSCSGLINDAVAIEGNLAVSVQGRIQNGQLSVQVKVDYKGTAVTTVGNLSYLVNGSMSASETTPMTSEPVDVFVRGVIKLTSKNKASNLYISDLGYITVYPDGTVINHVLNPKNNPEYSHPKVYCSEEEGS